MNYMQKKGTPVFKMAKGGNVTNMSRLQLEDYISKNYLPNLSLVAMNFIFFDTIYSYNLIGDSVLTRNSLLKYYTENSDFTESSLKEKTNFKINEDWEIVEIIKDPENNEIIEERELELISQDNTYNFSYLGLIDLNWRVYYDEINEQYFYVIHPHKGGDIRGNYEEALILKGNNKEDLFIRYYNNFIGGGASINFEFKDGSYLLFNSENDSDVFNFKFLEENSKINSKIAQHLIDDFEKFQGSDGDEFLQQIVEEFNIENNPKYISGGVVGTPIAYIQILGFNEGDWMDLSLYDNGDDFMEAINTYMLELNNIDGRNREEYRVADFEGFGDGIYYEYMGETEFDNIIQGYKSYQNTNFPIAVVEEYKSDIGSEEYTDALTSMKDNFIGQYDDFEDVGYQFVKDGSFQVTESYVYITNTDKRLLAGEEADFKADNMNFDELLEIATETNTDFQKEKSSLEIKLEEIQEDLSDLQSLYDTQEDEEDYEKTMEFMGEKEILIEEIEAEIEGLEDNYISRARQESIGIFYDLIYDQLDRNLLSWLEENEYTDDLSNVSFLSVDYEEIGKDVAGDYLTIENNNEIFIFSTYVGGGKAIKTKNKTFEFYVVEEKNKKIISGYLTKEDAIKNKGNLIRQYKGLVFNIYEKNALDKKTNLNANNKEDYINLSELKNSSKIAIEPSKLKIIGYKVKEGGKKGLKYVKEQWEDLDFGDGKGGAKFDNGGESNREKILDDSRKKYEMTEMSIKLKIANTLGIDEAIKFMNSYQNNSIHPFNLIRSAVNKNFITTDEITRDIINESIYESDDITSTYKESGEGIGSSDENSFVYNMLKSAGVPMGYVNNRFVRTDILAQEKKMQDEQIAREKKMQDEQMAQEKKMQDEQMAQEKKIQDEQMAQEKKMQDEQMAQEKKMQEMIEKHKIIITPSKKYLIINENEEIIKENNKSKYFETKDDAQNYIKTNLSNFEKANVGAILMAVDYIQKQRQEQLEEQRQIEVQNQINAQNQAIQEQQELEKEAISTNIIMDDSIEVNLPNN